MPYHPTAVPACPAAVISRRHRFPRPFAVVLCLLLALTLCRAGSADTDRKLTALRVGAFDASGLTVGQAIEKLSTTVASLGGGEYTVRAVIDSAQTPDFKKQTFPKLTPKPLLLDRPASLAKKDAPVIALAQALAAQAGGSVTVRGKEILIYPAGGTFEPLVIETFQLPPRAGGNLEIQSQLAEQGIKFYEGSYARLTAKTGQLVVRTTQEQIDLIHSLVD